MNMCYYELIPSKPRVAGKGSSLMAPTTWIREEGGEIARIFFPRIYVMEPWHSTTQWQIIIGHWNYPEKMLWGMASIVLLIILNVQNHPSINLEFFCSMVIHSNLRTIPICWTEISTSLEKHYDVRSILQLVLTTHCDSRFCVKPGDFSWLMTWMIPNSN